MLLKLVTFNLKRTILRWDKRNFLNRVAAFQEFFAQQKPDLVGTQELTIRDLRQAEEALPQYRWIGLGRGGGHRSEFSAIFYRPDRLRLLDQGTFWLSSHPERPGSRGLMAVFPRICTWGLFETVETGQKIRVYNTHLDHVSPLARAEGIRVIQEHIHRHQSPQADGTILMGDFNASPASKVLRMLRDSDRRIFTHDSYTLTLQKEPLCCRTYHGFSGKVNGRPIDYIFVSGGLEIADAAIDRGVYDNQYPSDHYPIVMELALPARA